MKLIYELAAWFRGWRYDKDGWLVRARQADDTELFPVDGFTEESCVAVRNAAVAWFVDKRGTPK